MRPSPPPPSEPRPRPPSQGLRAAAADNRWVAGARRRYRGSTPETFLQRLKDMNFATTITLIGATALLSALPFVILMDAFFANRRIEDDLTHHMGLNDRAARIVDGLFTNPSLQSVPAVVLALLFSLAGMIGLAGMVQHLYEQTFAQPHHKSRAQLPRLLLWVVTLCVWLALDSLIGAATGGLPGGPVLDALAVLVGATAFFWASMLLLLGRHVPARTLLLPAAVSALFWVGLQVFASLYFSATIINDNRLYGPVGVIFSLLTWFTAIAAVIILGAMTGEVWRQRRHAKPPEGPPPAGPARQPTAPVPEQPTEALSS
jgi:membrane protein